jgi:hypothetical protein
LSIDRQYYFSFLIITIDPESIKFLKQDLDIRRNSLSDISIADALSSCPNLRSLFLTGNPICQAPSYRLVISSLVGSLLTLDGIKVDPQAQQKVTGAMMLEGQQEMRCEYKEISYLGEVRL